MKPAAILKRKARFTGAEILYKNILQLELLL
jgi:hypothetical protein